MAEITARSESGRSPVDIVIDRVWRFLCSVRAAIAEIAVLALLVLIGTLRGSDAPRWLADAIPATQGLVDRWYDWDVYASVPFAAILALLALAIAVCTINRVPTIWQSISHPKIKTSRGYLRSAESSAIFRKEETAGGDSALEDDVLQTLRAKRYRVITEQAGNETHFYADKNRFGRFGTFPFHLGLILLLVGGLVGAQFGFHDNEFIIPEGGTLDVGHGSGMTVTLDRFTDSYSEMGVADLYQSDVTITRFGTEIASGPITVNNPINAHGANFYQGSFGYGADITVTDQEGAVLFSEPIDMVLYNLVENPDAMAGFAEIPGTDMLLTIVGPDTDPLSRPELDTLGVRSGELWIQMQPISSGEPAGDASATELAEHPNEIVTVGQSATLGDYTVSFDRERRFSLLLVGYNPGIPIFIIASLMLVGGLASTFYFPLRRIRGIISRDPDGTTCHMVPMAKRDWGGKRDFYQTVNAITETSGTKPELKVPGSEQDWEGFNTSPTQST